MSDFQNKKSKKSIPVTILTGFLGSGKTTLVNHILANNKNIKFAVIENEFGEVGVDDGLIGNRLFGSEEEIVEMMNGYICCTVRSDLVKVLKRLLLEEKRKFDAILIETTGLADPAPVAQTFFVDEVIQKLCYLDAIITVVDAKHVTQHLDREVKTVINADAINSSAEIIATTKSVVDANQILNVKGFSLDRLTHPKFLEEEGVEHTHDDTVSSISLMIDQPIDINKLGNWIMTLLQTEGNNLFRYKGIIHAMGVDEKYVFQGIHMLFRGDFIGNWKEEASQRQSRFVFIGKNLNKAFLKEGFLECIAKPLRFPIGTTVFARTSTNGYEAGAITKQWDEGNAYRITLKSGDDVWAPEDIDEYVKNV